MSYSDLPHLRSNVAGVAAGIAPSVAGGAAAGTGATVSVVGTDQAGTISITTAGTPSAAATLVTLTFATPYSVVPAAVSVDAGDSHTAAQGLYATVTGTTLTISTTGSALTSALSLKVYYAVIGGA